MPNKAPEINDSNTFVISSKAGPKTVFLNGMHEGIYTWIYDPRVAWPFTRQHAQDRAEQVARCGHPDAIATTRAAALRMVDRQDIIEDREVPNV